MSEAHGSRLRTAVSEKGRSARVFRLCEPMCPDFFPFTHVDSRGQVPCSGSGFRIPLESCSRKHHGATSVAGSIGQPSLVHGRALGGGRSTPSRSMFPLSGYVGVHRFSRVVLKIHWSRGMHAGPGSGLPYFRTYAGFSIAKAKKLLRCSACRPVNVPIDGAPAAHHGWTHHGPIRQARRAQCEPSGHLHRSGVPILLSVDLGCSITSMLAAGSLLTQLGYIPRIVTLTFRSSSCSGYLFSCFSRLA